MMKLCLPMNAMALCAALCCGGCGPAGPPMAEVTGTVTYQGQPVPDGHIIFRSDDGVTVSSAGKVTDGQFAFQSLLGPKKVMITARRPTGKIDRSNPDEEVPIVEQYIPPAYNQRTTLSVNVAEAAEQFAFELTDPRRR